jgi:hypothetical protein
MAKAGYFGGDPAKALEAPADIFLTALDYEIFCNEFEAVEYELNKPPEK